MVKWFIGYFNKGDGDGPWGSIDPLAGLDYNHLKVQGCMALYIDEWNSPNESLRGVAE